MGGCVERGAQESYRQSSHHLTESKPQEWTRRWLRECVYSEKMFETKTLGNSKVKVVLGTEEDDPLKEIVH